MKAGTSTDDYLLVDGRLWTIVDSGPNVTPLCGICTGYSVYGSRKEDRISYESVLEIRDGILSMGSDTSTELVLLSGWRNVYDRFIGIERADDHIPYTGWLLLYGDALWNTALEEGLFAPRIAEARFNDGKLIEFIDHTSALEIMRSHLAGYHAMEIIQSQADRERICERLSSLLVGSYNCTQPGFPVIAKRRGWGGSDSDEYKCFNCKKLEDAGVLPIRKPKHTRKLKYQNMSQIVPGFLPGWTHDLAARIDVFGNHDSTQQPDSD